jgi:putative acetyltransferase
MARSYDCAVTDSALDRHSIPPVAVRILPTPPDSPVARSVIAELEAVLDPHYPEESRHGYDVDRLMSEGVDFFLVHHDDQVAGSGGIQFYGSDYGESKRMYIRPVFRGRGLGRLLIEHLSEHAVSRGVGLLRLETGIYQDEAIRLYEGTGFYRVAPFGHYRPDPLSIFFERESALRSVADGI